MSLLQAGLLPFPQICNFNFAKKLVDHFFSWRSADSLFFGTLTNHSLTVGLLWAGWTPKAKGKNNYHREERGERGFARKSKRKTESIISIQQMGRRKYSFKVEP